MVEPGEIFAAAKAAKDTVTGAQKLARKANPNGRLKNLVIAEVGKAHQVSTRAKVVQKRIGDVWVDPDVIGPVGRLLENGQWSEEKPLLEKRLSELFAFKDPAINDAVVVEITVAAIENNLVAALVEPTDKAHLDEQVTRDTVLGSAGKILDNQAALSEKQDEALERIEQLEKQRDQRSAEVEELLTRAQDDPSQAEAVATLAEGVQALSAEMAALREAVGSLSSALVQEVDSSDEAVVRLAEKDKPGASSLQQALEAGGEERALDLIRNPQSWVEEGSAALWVALGRIAQRLNDYEAAEEAFLRAADHPGVEDHSRQLVRASIMAKVDGRPERFKELLARADREHPAVVLATVRDLGTSDEMLQALESIESHALLDDPLRVELEIVRAGALLNDGREEEAEAALERARAIESDNIMVREFEAVLPLVTEQRKLSAGIEPDLGRLIAAGERFEELYREVLRKKQFAGAGAQAARAVEAFAVAGERQRASTILDEVVEQEALYVGDLFQEAQLAEGALLAQRFELVPRYARAAEPEAHRLLRADAVVLGENADLLDEAVADLDDIIANTTDAAIRSRAALGRLSAASLSDVEWSEEAEKILQEDRPWLVAMLKAERLAEDGEPEEAERLLLAHGDRATPLRFRIQLAANAEDWEKAIGLADTLVKTVGTEDDLVRRAALIGASGDRAGAHKEFLTLARNDALLTRTRANAYGGALETAESQNTAIELAAEWQDFAPSDDRARWQRVYGLMRLSRYEDAYEVWLDRPPSIEIEDQADLVTSLLALGGEMPQALQEMADISDQFARPELLEGRMLLRHLQAGQEGVELPPELATAIAQRAEDFFTRFPDSTILRRVKIDPDDPIGALRDLTGGSDPERDRNLQEAQKKVVEGKAPMSMLAALAGRSIGEIWIRAGTLPLGYGAPQLDSLEKADARDAIARGAAAWDPASLFIVAGLPPGYRDKLKAALPGSVIAQSTHDDVASDLPKWKEGEHEEIAFGSTGEAIHIEWSKELVQRDELRQRETLEFAQGFEVRSDIDPGTPDELDEVLRNESPHSFQSWPATLALARRLGLAVYSDDRYIRLSARQMGLKAFGTLALINALEEIESLGGEDRSALRDILFASRASGLDLTAEELIAFGGREGFLLTDELTAAFNDLSAWRERPRGLWGSILPFLQAVFEHDPKLFDVWVARALDAAVSAQPAAHRDVHAANLILLALDPISATPIVSDECLRAIVAVLKDRLPLYLRYRREKEPEVIALESLAAWSANQTATQRTALLLRVHERFGEDYEAVVVEFLGP